MSPADTVITYTSEAPWMGGLPVLHNSTTKYNFTYITMKNADSIFVFRIPDMALDTLPDVHVFDNINISTSEWANRFAIHGYSKLYYLSNDDHCIHTLDLETDTQTATQYQAGMSFLGTDYLIINWTEGATIHYQLIDEDGNVTTPYVNPNQTIRNIDLVSPDIGGGVYIA